MKKRKAKIIVGLLTLAMVITGVLPNFTSVVSAENNRQEAVLKQTGFLEGFSNPYIVPDSNMQAGQKVTWDCVWFGSYPQAEVVPASREYTALDKELLQAGDLIRDDELYQKLTSATGWNEKGDVIVDGEQYRRIKKEDATYVSSDSGFYQWENETDYHYFKYQPIKWRVLSTDGAEAFLMADKALDDKQCRSAYESATWEESIMRSWLNGYGASANKQNKDYSNSNFIDTAFDKNMQVIIKETEVENKDNISDGTEGGKNTVDKIFLLSESEVYTDAAKGYGFVLDKNIYDEARRAKSSLYAKALGTWSSASGDYKGNCDWWLRTPGANSYRVMNVFFDGSLYGNLSFIKDYSLGGMRPVLNLNLATLSDTDSDSLCSYAGTVCSDGTVNEKSPSEKMPFSNPRIEKDSSMQAGQKVIWDCIWFGSYPQAEVVLGGDTSSNEDLSIEGNLIKDSVLYQKLQSATEWDEQGDITVEGEKYRKIEKKEYNEPTIHYYKYQPIKWRVLSVDSSKIFLLADRILDSRPYHIVKEDVTWEESTMRSWLNGYDASANKQKQDYSEENFIQSAFDASRQSAILVTDVENKDNLSFGTAGGADTKDKVFLLSESEVYTDAARVYGFSLEANLKDEARKAKTADALIEKAWWIRSPGLESFYASEVERTGWIYKDGNFNMAENNGVRPALNLKISAGMESSFLYSYAGTVSSDGTEDEIPYVGANLDIAECDISLAASSYTYDGTAKEPKIIVKDGSNILENGKDYKVSYSNNINTGEAVVHIIGIGSYQGEIFKTFKIVPKSISSAVVTLENYTYTYDGTAKKPAVIVKDGEVALRSAEDYEFGYSDNVSVGTAKVTVRGKGNYSGTATKTFVIIPSATPIEPLKSFTWSRDNWNFNNSNSYFPSGKYVNQINNTYLNKLKQNLTNTEYRAVFNTIDGWLYDTWGGSCYGMSSTSILGMHNLLAYPDYKSGAENLYQLDSPVNDKNISSLVTYYQMLQVKDVTQQQYRTVPYKTNKNNINKIISLLDENPLVLVGFKKENWGGHAILAYGYEYGDYTWNGVSYDGCIKICDPNSSKQYRAEFNIYFNTDTYDWTIPIYCSGSNGPITSRAGAVFNYIGADVDEINEGGYIGKSQAKDSALDYVARIDINTDAEAEDYSVVKVEKSNGEYAEKDDNLDDIKEQDSYILAGESKGTAGFDLFDSESAYKVTQKGDKEMALSIDYGNCYLESELSDGNYVIFDKNGYVEMSGDVGDFNISMTFNEDYPTKWSTVEVSGSGADEISVEKGDEGYIISGDTLKNVDVELEHKDESIQTSFSTEYDTVCICEIDEDTAGVKVDTDGNGTYETIIKTSDKQENPVSTSSPTPTTTAVPFQPPVIIPSSSPSTVPTISPATEVPQNTATPEPTNTPEVTVSPDPIATPVPTVQPDNSSGADNEDNNSSNALKKGAKVTDKKTQAVYKVTGTGKNKTVEYVKCTKKNASKVTVPAKVKLNGHNYKVVSIAPNAFKNNLKLSYITIGKNVKKIGKKAFFGCKKLRYIDVKSKKLTAKSIGKQAFSMGYKLPRVKSAKNVWRKYSRILPTKGLSKRTVFIINPVKLVQ